MSYAAIEGSSSDEEGSHDDVATHAGYGAVVDDESDTESLDEGDRRRPLTLSQAAAYGSTIGSTSSSSQSSDDESAAGAEAPAQSAAVDVCSSPVATYAANVISAHATAAQKVPSLL